ncbi:MAG: hypothetical protein E7171_04200 [Firmicutes bacterium]|nr:hypothetical protein [Bacillota bacterium]
METLDFKEAVTLFLDRTMSDLKNESEIPALNIVFPDSAFKLFEYIKEHPFEKDGSYVPPLYDRDIEKAKIENNSKPELPNIIIHNPVKFFELLTDIINSWHDKKNKHWGSYGHRALFIQNIKRLFLRMSPNDMLNIESFLQRELSFIQDKTFDEYIGKNTIIGEYEGYQLKTSLEEAPSWCETTNKMTFFLTNDNNEFHTLPSIYFGITEEYGEQVCYIYAIQNERHRAENKRIQRTLYKLNKGIENPDVNPASILVLQTFINMLKEKGITNIKVPCLQALSYRYHEILSDTTKRDFEKNYSPDQLEYINNLNSYDRERKLEEYEWQKLWYSHVVDKQDFISYTKTEGLFKIFRRVQDQFSSIELLNTPFIEDENLNIRISNEPKKQKKIV